MARHKSPRLNQRLLDEGIAHLSAVDPDFKRAVETCGVPPLRKRPLGYATLLQSIVGQQVSVHAARSIWNRLEQKLGKVTPEAFLTLSDQDLRAVGFSGQKTRYGRLLAADIVAGKVDLAGVVRMDDETAIAELVKGMGIGRWTAEIYLMFAHGRTDIMPAADLGLIVAAQHLKGLRQRPKPMRLLKLAEAWRPWRSVAALMLWHYRHNMPDWSTPAKKKLLAAPARKKASNKKTPKKKAAKRKT